MLNKFFRPKLIVGALPVTLLNGTTADATQVMSDLNWLVNQVNANAAPLNSPTFTGTVTTAAIAATNITASGTLAVTGAATLASITGAAIATQADQETSTSTTTSVSPGRQQFHPSAAKCWGFVTVSAGTPTLQASFNMTSITDAGVGQVTFTIATDFSSANYALTHGVTRVTNVTTVAGAQVAGSFDVYVLDSAGSPTDTYDGLSAICAGDQA